MSRRNGNFDIYVIRANGTGERRLTVNEEQDLSPSWSPNGRKIAFAGQRAGQFDVYVMNPNGTRQTRLTSGPADEGEPAWQPLPRRR